MGLFARVRMCRLALVGSAFLMDLRVVLPHPRTHTHSLKSNSHVCIPAGVRWVAQCDEVIVNLLYCLDSPNEHIYLLN